MGHRHLVEDGSAAAVREYARMGVSRAGAAGVLAESYGLTAIGTALPSASAAGEFSLSLRIPHRQFCGALSPRVVYKYRFGWTPVGAETSATRSDPNFFGVPILILPGAE